LDSPANGMDDNERPKIWNLLGNSHDVSQIIPTFELVIGLLFIDFVSNARVSTVEREEKIVTYDENK
jgi:hypothetical protein